MEVRPTSMQDRSSSVEVQLSFLFRRYAFHSCPTKPRGRIDMMGRGDLGIPFSPGFTCVPGQLKQRANVHMI
jgi:hypothetical protein